MGRNEGNGRILEKRINVNPKYIYIQCCQKQQVISNARLTQQPKNLQHHSREISEFSEIHFSYLIISHLWLYNSHFDGLIEELADILDIIIFESYLSRILSYLQMTEPLFFSYQTHYSNQENTNLKTKHFKMQVFTVLTII